jgi:amino-acid N-acetyltransferase
VTRHADISLRSARSSDGSKLYKLIAANMQEGHLLPRTLAEVTGHAERFVIAMRGPRAVGCAELAPLGPLVAEVRSLVVDPSARGRGVGTVIIGELRQRARRKGFERLAVFTHAPGYFVPMGFSIVPHLWVREKISTDCAACPRFRQCGQFAMVLPIDPIDSMDREASIAVRPA